MTQLSISIIALLMEEMYEMMKDEILIFKVNHDYWLIYSRTTKQQQLVEYL